jgi:Fe-S-cluster containining protein
LNPKIDLRKVELHNLGNQARKAEKETKRLFEKIKKVKPKDLDEKFEKFHDEAFESIDCLSCGNCCKTTSPIVTQLDINRLSKYLRIKPIAFTERYLTPHVDNTFVLRVTPCPFLDTDNSCSVYEDRPNSCRDYPFTNRKKMYQVLDITLKNTFVCPAVYQIVENIKKVIK